MIRLNHALLARVTVLGSAFVVASVLVASYNRTSMVVKAAEPVRVVHVPANKPREPSVPRQKVQPVTEAEKVTSAHEEVVPVAEEVDLDQRGLGDVAAISIDPVWKSEFHRFPHILNTWHQVVAWEREGNSAEAAAVALLEASADGNLPLAAAAQAQMTRQGKATATVGLEGLSQESRAEFERLRGVIRSGALAYLRTRTERWGAEILLERAFAPAGWQEGLAEGLLAQFREDDVPFNAAHAAEFYIAGLRNDRVAFLPPLLARLKEVARSGKDEQEELFLLSLALGAVLIREDDYASQSMTFWTATVQPQYPREEPLAGLTRDEANTLLEASVKLQGNGLWRAGDQVPREPLHDMARLFLELTFPEGRDLLSKRVIDGTLQDFDAVWVLGLHLGHDPGVLFANYGEVFIQVVRRSSYPSWNNDPCSAELGQLFSPHDDPSLEFYGRKPYRGTRIFYSDRMGNWNRNWPSFSSWHRDACALLREALRTESDGRAQVALSSALEAAQDKESQELRGIIAVTHLVDDSISWNADCSSSYLSALGEEAILYVTAGLKAGVKIDDWQLVVLANNILYQIDPNHNPANWSYVNEFLWEQMKDDEIDGNATGAIHYFQRWGPDSIPFLMSHENHDQQRQRAVERIVREVERDE